MGTNKIALPAGFELDQGSSLPAGFERDAAPRSQSWGDVAGSAATQFLPSVGKMVGDIYDVVTSPIETAKNIGKVVVGAGEAGAEKLAGMVDPELVAFNRQLNAPSERQQMAGQMGEFYKQRYGSEEGFKKALSTDPAGVMADMATLLTGGGGAASKLGLGKVGGALSQAGAAVDPLALTAKAAGGVANVVGKGAQIGLGTSTGAGAEAIKQAYQAGKQGGQQAESFQSNLRGNAPMTDVLDTAKADLAAMNAAKTDEYRSNMKAVAADKSILSLDPIGEDIARAYGQVTFKGQIKNQKGAEVLQKISDAVGDWKGLNPEEFHTPEGLDALKQVVGGIVENIPFEEKTARMVGSNIYNSIKNQITQQAPVYSKTMKDYADASDQIKEIERALSLGNKAAVDTSMRKLQSLMRNNVSTNYGQRLKLAQELEQKGGGQLMPALAGQALSSWQPRGLQGAATVGATLVNPMALAAAPALVPRIAGETAYYAGKGANVANLGKNALTSLIKNPRIAANLAYQAQQPKR